MVQIGQEPVWSWTSCLTIFVSLSVICICLQTLASSYVFTYVHAYMCTHTHGGGGLICLGYSPTSTLVCWVGSQRVPEVTCLALVTVDTCCVVDAFQAPACQPVTIPRGIGVHIIVALAALTRPDWTTFPKGIPEIAIGTELTAGTWEGTKEDVFTPDGYLTAVGPEREV